MVGKTTAQSPQPEDPGDADRPAQQPVPTLNYPTKISK